MLQGHLMQHMVDTFPTLQHPRPAVTGGDMVHSRLSSSCPVIISPANNQHQYWTRLLHSWDMYRVVGSNISTSNSLVQVLLTVLLMFLRQLRAIFQLLPVHHLVQHQSTISTLTVQGSCAEFRGLHSFHSNTRPSTGALLQQAGYILYRSH